MKISPASPNLIKIQLSSGVDWLRLGEIIADASCLETDLAHRLARKMDIEGDWEDYVLPDIKDHFSSQLMQVQEELKRAHPEDGHVGELIISPANVDVWYGALNQARLALESKYALSKHNKDAPQAVARLDYEIRSALARSHFYCFLLSIFLEHVMV
jgi:hypothetical protein